MKKTMIKKFIYGFIILSCFSSTAWSQSLFEILDQTYHHYDQFKALDAGKITAEEKVIQAYRQRYPHIGIDAGYGVGHINRYELGDENQKRKQASVRLVQNVWTGGRFDAELDKAEALKIAGFAGADDEKNNILYQSGITYLKLVRMQELKKLYEEFNAIFADYHKKIGLEFEAGSRSSAEVATAAARLAENKAEYSQVVGEYDSLKAKLYSFTGQEIKDPIFPNLNDFKLPAALEPALLELEKSNPTLQKSRAEINVASAELDAAKAGRMPNLTLEASDNYQNTDVFNTQKTHYSMLMAKVNIPIFQRGVEYSMTREKTAAYHENRYKYAALKQEIAQHFTESWWRYDATTRQCTAYEQSITASENAVSALKKEYEHGFGSAILVLDQEKSVLTSKIAMINLKNEQASHALKMMILLNKKPNG